MARRCCILTCLALAQPVLSTPPRADIDPSKVATSCEAIIKFAYPDLCDLEVEQGSMRARGLELAFWRYRSRDRPVSKTPLVVVHGGPAYGHTYMLPLKQQACRGREVVFYDQVGAGSSEKPHDPNKSAPWLFTVDYYVEELIGLVDFLGWQQFHVLGHSWGSVIGQALAVRQDPRLQALVLSGPLSDGQLWLKSQWDQREGSLGSLPLFVQDVIRQISESKDFSSKLAGALDGHLTGLFSLRTYPTPDCARHAFVSLSNPTSRSIYVGMQGEGEFSLGGVLSTMNYTAQLPSISNPVLLTSGKYDSMRRPVVDVMHKSLPNSWWAILPHSAHVSMIDDPRLMNDLVGDFLDRQEAGTLQSFELRSGAELFTYPEARPSDASVKKAFLAKRPEEEIER